MCKNTRVVKGKVELPQTPHQMLLSPVDVANGPDFPT